jgi:quinoprotein dehydrogenase-associated probable ABC transporter substrate-binding protein
MRAMLRRTFTLCASSALAGCRGAGRSKRTGRVLRVCADPNNLPFSNDRREGFENRIAELIAQEWNLPLEYTWWAQRRGFIRNTLEAGLCDLLIGVPARYERVLTTAPYYRSTYVFVYRKDAGFSIDSYDSPLLHKLRVGVQLIGEDGNNSPPAHELARRGVIGNVKGFRVAGDYGQPNPPARIIDAVGHGDIDIAVAWGPMAGYFARRQPVALTVVPVPAQAQPLSLPVAFDISMGVRRGEEELRRELEELLIRKKGAIDGILDSYGVPRL